MNSRFGVSTLAAVLAVAGLGVGGVAGYRLINGQCPLSGACMKDSAAVTTVSEKTSSCCPLKGAADAQTVALTEVSSECGAKTECSGEKVSECSMAKSECSSMKTECSAAKTACHGEAGTTVLASETSGAKKSDCCQGDSESCDPADCVKGKECCKSGEKKEEVAAGDKPAGATGG